jgi:hypothetical protein
MGFPIVFLAVLLDELERATVSRRAALLVSNRRPDKRGRRLPVWLDVQHRYAACSEGPRGSLVGDSGGIPSPQPLLNFRIRLAGLLPTHYQSASDGVTLPHLWEDGTQFWTGTEGLCSAPFSIWRAARCHSLAVSL